MARKSYLIEWLFWLFSTRDERYYFHMEGRRRSRHKLRMAARGENGHRACKVRMQMPKVIVISHRCEVHTRWVLHFEYMLLQWCPSCKWWRFTEIIPYVQFQSHLTSTQDGPPWNAPCMDARCMQGIDGIEVASWLFWEFFHAIWKILFSCGGEHAGGGEVRMHTHGTSYQMKFFTLRHFDPFDRQTPNRLAALLRSIKWDSNWSTRCGWWEPPVS